MDPQHLRYFLAVTETGSVTAAASVLDVAPPSVSHGLRALERDLGACLFLRVGRGMVLTSAGQALVTPARGVLRSLSQAGGTVRDAEGHMQGHLTLRCPAALSTGVLSRLLTTFHREHPKVSVTVDDLGQGDDVRLLLREGVCDLALAHLQVAGPSLESDADVEVLPLGVQEQRLAFPPGTVVPPHDPISPVDVAVVAIQVPGDDPVLLEETPGRPRPVLHHRESRLAFTEAGVGASWIESSRVGLAREHGMEVRSMSGTRPVPFGLVVPHRTLTPAAAEFVRAARDYRAASNPFEPDSSSMTASRATAAGTR